MAPFRSRGTARLVGAPIRFDATSIERKLRSSPCSGGSGVYRPQCVARIHRFSSRNPFSSLISVLEERSPPMHLGKRAIAEFLGTFWLTFGGCGAAVISAAYPQLGIGFLGVALAFGLTVVTMAYAVGYISGAHFNPAITIGLWAARRIPFRDVIPYIVFQVAGAIAAAAVLKIVAEGHPG